MGPVPCLSIRAAQIFLHDIVAPTSNAAVLCTCSTLCKRVIKVTVASKQLNIRMPKVTLQFSSVHCEPSNSNK